MCESREDGLKQLSITLPVELNPMFKDFANRVKDREPATLEMSELITGTKPSLNPSGFPSSRMALPDRKLETFVADLP